MRVLKLLFYPASGSGPDPFGPPESWKPNFFVFQVRTIQSFHIEGRKWSDIAYNYLVGGEGAVYEGRGWDKEGAHTLGWNNKSIGICLIGTFTTIEPTQRQLTATQRLIARGVKLGKIDQNYRLLAHKQVQSTESPGRLMFAIMKTWPHWYNTSVSEDWLYAQQRNPAGVYI